MKCPGCNANDNYKVLRTLRGTYGVVRQIECLSCGDVYFTGEAVVVSNAPPDKICQKTTA